MDNKFDNIDEQNQDIYNLIESEFRQENLHDEIRMMVSKKMQSTDFQTMLNTNAFSSILSSGSISILGLMIVAGAFTIYYFMSKDNESEISNNQIIAEQPIKTYNALNEAKSDVVLPSNNSNNVSSIESENTSPQKNIKTSSQTEQLSVEAEEYEHFQTINLKQEISDEYISNAFKTIFNNMGLKYNESINQKNIILQTNQLSGNFDNMQVSYSISLIFSKIDRNKVIAKLKYRKTHNKSVGLDVGTLFYESLTAELRSNF
ncbi:MAG TPA: hypothetical protein PLE30_05540 [Candidatus Kapabacteria bacterium]|nr:hypothetical protein [Candidatus Kapabacteria bacterium]